MKPIYVRSMYVTYALYSIKYDKIYIGYTSSIIERFHSHNMHSIKGFTSKYRPWMVVYVEYHDSKSDAMRREKELKSSRGRDFIRKQVEIVALLSVS